MSKTLNNCLAARGMVTAKIASRFSPNFSALGDIAQTVKISIGAGIYGDKTLSAHTCAGDIFFNPAKAAAPAGSVIERLSSKCL